MLWFLVSWIDECVVSFVGVDAVVPIYLQLRLLPGATDIVKYKAAVIIVPTECILSCCGCEGRGGCYGHKT